MSRLLKIVGETKDGTPVIAGLYRMYETHGVPLDVLLDAVREKRMMVCWLGLYDEGIEAGANPERWLRTIGNSVADSWGPEWGLTVTTGITIGRLG